MLSRAFYAILAYLNLPITLLRSLSRGRDMAKSNKTIYSKQSRQLREVLKELRTEQGVRQDEIARRLKIDQSMVARVESGERRLDVVELIRWCDALGVSVAEFVTRFERLRNG